MLVSLYVDDLLVSYKKWFRFGVRVYIGDETAGWNVRLGADEILSIGLKIYQCSYDIFHSQKKYTLDVPIKFQMDQSKCVATPLVLNEKLSKDDGGKKCNALA